MKKTNYKLYNFIRKIKAEICWKFPKLAFKGYELRGKISRYLNQKVIDFQLNGFSYMKCDTCGKQGIDYHAEENHRWKYEGCHYWSCDKCNDSKKIHDTLSSYE